MDLSHIKTCWYFEESDECFDELVRLINMSEDMPPRDLLRRLTGSSGTDDEGACRAYDGAFLMFLIARMSFHASWTPKPHAFVCSVSEDTYTVIEVRTPGRGGEIYAPWGTQLFDIPLAQCHLWASRLHQKFPLLLHIDDTPAKGRSGEYPAITNFGFSRSLKAPDISEKVSPFTRELLQGFREDTILSMQAPSPGDTHHASAPQTSAAAPPASHARELGGPTEVDQLPPASSRPTKAANGS